MELIAGLCDLHTIDDIIGEMAAPLAVFEADFSDSEDDSEDTNLHESGASGGVEVGGNFTDTEEE